MKQNPEQKTSPATPRGTTMKPTIIAMMTSIVSLAATAQAGVNLETTTPPGYGKPLTLYVSNGKILGAWAVGNKGNRNASSFECGFYVNGKRTLVARINNGLPAGYMTYGTDAPFDLPDGDSTVELRVNDSQWIAEDTFADNNYVIKVRVDRGGGGGGTPPLLTRAEATYKWPSSFGNSSASRIVSRMTEMHTVQFQPTADFSNWGYTNRTTGKDVYSPTYTRGTTYFGLPYSQCDPVTVAGFLGYAPRMSGTLNWTTSAGIDCSRSIAQAMELPSNHNTKAFDTSTSPYFTSVVAPGTLVKNASKIQIADAIVSASWGHMVLVVGTPVNGKVECLEATPGQGLNVNGQPQRWAVVRTNTRTLSDLDIENCRVIRRNNLQ